MRRLLTGREILVESRFLRVHSFENPEKRRTWAKLSHLNKSMHTSHQPFEKLCISMRARCSFWLSLYVLLANGGATISVRMLSREPLCLAFWSVKPALF